MRDPDALISTDDLAARLGQPGLRVYDCTTYLDPPDPGSEDPYKGVSGMKTFVAGHVPGADFLDLEGELSATDTKLKFTMPPPGHLARAFRRHGLGAGARVVLYRIGAMMWAPRALAKFTAAGISPDKHVIAYCGGGISATLDLFLLHQLGFDDLTLYDGSMGEWAKDPSLPIETG